MILPDLLSCGFPQAQEISQFPLATHYLLHCQQESQEAAKINEVAK
jgi:hypothetical protein